MEHILLEEWMMKDCKHYGELMIKNHLMDKLLKEVLRIERVMYTVKTKMVIHTVKTEMMRLVVEIECVGKIVDAFDKVTMSSDGLQPEQMDLNYVHALNEPHLHEIFVVLKYEAFRTKMYNNLNKLQRQLKRENPYSSNSKSCLKVLRTPFKEFFDSKEVNALEFHIKCWKKNFKDYTGWEPETYKHFLLWYLDELDKLIDEKALKYELEACLVNEVIEMDDILVSKECTDESVTSLEQPDERSYSQNESINSRNEIRSSDNEISSSDGNADIGHSYDSDTVNENNNNIISDIPDMDSDRDKKEDDYADYEQQRAFFASLINNLKCDVEKCNEVNREAQQENALLTNELERNKEKEKHFTKDMTIASEYCKKTKLLNDEISYLKSQAWEKDKTFAKENEKYDEYVQPLLKRKNKLEKKNQEFLKQINDLENRLRKAGQTDQTLRMLLSKEDNVQMGKQSLGFKNQNDNVNPSVLNKAKKLASCLYNIDEMGKDELSDRKIISEEELKCVAKKRLKVK
uniref:Reverse transcriptase zinc-binding domain-containing protein n=1 Tax=Tanacetum cinerariifolium TaxID=118510 RepID=A0A699HG70_TANCI|nr:reverse transcriptase zinc-binding domain-containing protein [Tanacetum cinerariifolium]